MTLKHSATQHGSHLPVVSCAYLTAAASLYGGIFFRSLFRLVPPGRTQPGALVDLIRSGAERADTVPQQFGGTYQG